MNRFVKVSLGRRRNGIQPCVNSSSTGCDRFWRSAFFPSGVSGSRTLTQRRNFPFSWNSGSSPLYMCSSAKSLLICQIAFSDALSGSLSSGGGAASGSSFAFGLFLSASTNLRRTCALSQNSNKAHARRKFADALPNKKEIPPDSAAVKGVDFCNRLFELEREYDGFEPEYTEDGSVRNWVKKHDPLDPEARKKQRQEKTKPVFDDFFAWLETIAPASKSALSSAVQYAKNEKTYLCRFQEDGNIPVSNNRAENAIRPFTIGRKNWLFTASVKGACASAMFYSVIATACANGLAPEEYLTRLFSSSPGTLVLPW